MIHIIYFLSHYESNSKHPLSNYYYFNRKVSKKKLNEQIF